MSERVTLKEVAARAGVSYQTVSKVLNKQAQVSKETEERIYAAVRELGYRPNQIARNMRTQCSRLIGYSWVPTPREQTNSILDQFLQSMAQAAEQASYHLLCFPYHADRDILAGYRELIDTNRVDAFVISGVEYDDPRIRFLQERAFPFVAFGRSNPELRFPCVDVDGAEGVRQTTDYLLGLGHRRIAVLAWPDVSRVGQNRIEGYLAAMHAAGIPPLPTWIARGEGDYRFGHLATGEWLTWPAAERPTAIVAFNDAMAIGAMHAIQQARLHVGRDIAVTGFDDSPVAQYLTPTLTSTRQPIWEVGQKVMSILLRILDDTPAFDTSCALLAPQLIIRQSSGGPIN
jgi:DNA-binding LacI/PurR family transcriptional regulator